MSLETLLTFSIVFAAALYVFLLVKASAKKLLQTSRDPKAAACTSCSGCTSDTKTQNKETCLNEKVQHSSSLIRIQKRPQKQPVQRL